MTEIIFDFESEEIAAPPDFPPKPVGLAITVNSEPITLAYYNAWGHPIENNCDEADIREAIEKLLKYEDGHWIAHNLAFDASIIQAKWGLRFPWTRATDTMLLAFMHDPYGKLSLKPLAEKHLGMPPTERDAVREWLVQHGHCRATDKDWGAYISKAPGNLVGVYAHGDLVRTGALAKFYRNQT